jgi:hypothetical protein
VFPSARAFAPHRHDAYAIGVTVSGVQTFRYRGGRASARLPGQVHVLHPDEPHDGAPGHGLASAIGSAYIAELIREALGDRDLPIRSRSCPSGRTEPGGSPRSWLTSTSLSTIWRAP